MIRQDMARLGHLKSTSTQWHPRLAAAALRSGDTHRNQCHPDARHLPECGQSLERGKRRLQAYLGSERPKEARWPAG